MMYLRIGFCKKLEKAVGGTYNGHPVFFTKAVNLEFEEKCLWYYEEIVKFILGKLENRGTLEDDFEILKNWENCKNLEKNC